jgi:thymidylate kinase
MAPGVADILFLADHLQNAYDIRELLQKGKVVITDRYADSQFAYAESPSKKCPRWVLKVFSEHFGPVPDITVLMLVKGIEEGWALTRANARRGIEAGKQNGKAWNDLSAQTTIQEAYLSLLLTEARTLPIWVRQEDTEEELHQRILDGVMDRILQTQACKQPVLPMYAEVERIGMVQ